MAKILGTLLIAQPRPQGLLLVQNGGRRNPWPKLLTQPWPGVSPTAILNEEKALGTRLLIAILDTYMSEDQEALQWEYGGNAKMCC